MHDVPRCSDLLWYFASAESRAGGLISQHESFASMVAIGPSNMPAPQSAETKLGTRFDQRGGVPSDAERARCIYLALQKLTREQVEVLGRAYGGEDLGQLVLNAYPGDFQARDRLRQAFGEYLGVVASWPEARHVARPSGAKGASVGNVGEILALAVALLNKALAAYQAAVAEVRDELAAYQPSGRAKARTATEMGATW
jgi:hypothetical protein